jgi:hypothetical protein
MSKEPFYVVFVKKKKKVYKMLENTVKIKLKLNIL